MKRRNFLIGVGGTAIGGSALLGSGAFSRVESQRAVDIKVAHDREAYVGLIRKAADEEEYLPEGVEPTPNSDNYTYYDEKGHLGIEIADNPNGGEGVNSNSRNFFDDMFVLMNNGKEEAEFCFDTTGLAYDLPNDNNDEPDADPEDVVVFYKGTAAGSNGLDGIAEVMCHDVDKPVDSQTIELEPGEWVQIGILVNTKGSSISASTTIEGEVVIRADVGGFDDNGND